MLRNSLIALFNLIFLAALAACSSQSSSKTNAPKRFGRVSFDVGSCEFDPFSGSTFSLNLQSPNTRPSDHFEKLFFPKELEKSLGASGYSIAKSLYESGVGVYRVSSGLNSSCRYFDYLQTPPQTAQENWDNLTQTGVNLTTLLGLFTTIYRKNLSSGVITLSNPTILIHDSTQKWTLLHEMSHYFFAKARSQIKFLLFNNELEDQISAIKANLDRQNKRFATKPTKHLAAKILKNYQQFFIKNFELDKRTALEEFSIESILLEYGINNQISDVNFDQESELAYLYMKRNGQEVIFSYFVFLDQLDSFKKILTKKPWSKIETALLRLQRSIEQKINFIDQKISNASRFSSSPDDIPFLRFQQNLEQIPHDHYDLEKFKKRHRSIRDWANF